MVSHREETSALDKLYNKKIHYPKLDKFSGRYRECNSCKSPMCGLHISHGPQFGGPA